MSPYVQPICTCALVSSAISAAFSPPHNPARSFGGRTAFVGSQGPIVAAAAANTTIALVSMRPPYQSTLWKRRLVTKAVPLGRVVPVRHVAPLFSNEEIGGEINIAPPP